MSFTFKLISCAYIAYICAQRSMVECQHLISCARSSKYCHFVVTNVAKDGPSAECNCFFTVDLFWFEEIVSGNGEYQEIQLI